MISWLYKMAKFTLLDLQRGQGFEVILKRKNKLSRYMKRFVIHHWNRLGETVLMRGHNLYSLAQHICYLEIWEIFCNPIKSGELPCPGPKIIKYFSCSTQLSLKFFLPINVKIYEQENSILGLSEPEKCWIS